MKLSDIVTGLIFVAAGCSIAIEAQHFPPVPGQPYGSRFFPTLVGGAMAICGLLLAGNAIIRKRYWPLVSLPVWLRSGRGIASFAIVLAALLAYMLLAGSLGFCLTAFIIFVTLQKWMGARWLPAVLVSMGATAIFYLVFAVLLRVPLAHGVIERFL